MAYIPKEHKQFNVLPFCTEHGGEVFCYPSELVDQIGAYYPRGVHFIPYGYQSYEEYYEFLRKQRDKTRDETVRSLLRKLEENIAYLNRKEEWSICRYVGNAMSLVTGLTQGQCYYWPCCADNPVYNGVIDDEEFTSYWYPTDKNLWEIVWDPTGMVRNEMSNPKHENKREYFNQVMNSVNGDNWTDI